MILPSLSDLHLRYCCVSSLHHFSFTKLHQQQPHIACLSTNQEKWAFPQDTSKVASWPRAHAAGTGGWRSSLSRGASATRPSVGRRHLEQRGKRTCCWWGWLIIFTAHMLPQIYEGVLCALDTRWRTLNAANREKERLSGDFHKPHFWTESRTSWPQHAARAAPVCRRVCESAEATDTQQQLHPAAVSESEAWGGWAPARDSFWWLNHSMQTTLCLLDRCYSLFF